MRTHEDVIASEGDVEARVLHAGHGVEDAIDVLDRAEQSAGVPLVDEAERARLQGLAAGRVERGRHWHSLLARRGSTPVGYAGVVLATDEDVTAGGPASDDRLHAPAGAPPRAVADLAAVQSRPDAGAGVGSDGVRSDVVAALLSGVEALGWHHGADRVQVWIRHASAADLGCAVDHGFGVERRLGVLGTSLAEPIAEPDVPAGHTLRTFEPGRDEQAVVELLEAAYRDTPEAGWTRERLARRTGYDWFRAEDLLLLDAGDHLAGLHWTKRRGDGVGECYNLAVDPADQGRGLGAVLLAAGLVHLREVGCREVLLWVDLSNERAVRLYTSNGFRTRWEDLALSRVLRAPPR